MPTALNEHQFEILPYEDADTGVLFGLGCDIEVDEKGFKPGGPSWMKQSTVNPKNGATAFGRDVLQGSPWAWSLFVDSDNTPNALTSLGVLAKAWRARQIRESVGEVTSLRYRVGNRTRRIFGRPDRFEGAFDNGILTGLIPVDATFDTADGNHYDDEETSVRIDLQVNPDLGGLVFPTVLPQVLVPVADQSSGLLVGGDEDTHPIIRFEGPMINPTIETGDWSLTLNITLADGEYVEVDTRPWVNTVMFNGDTSVAGALGTRQWLSTIILSPGQHDVRVSASSSSPGGSCEVRWRSAWSSL